MRKIFICHESVAIAEATKFKELLSTTAQRGSRETEIFLSSDWDSLESGAPWFGPVLEHLREADAFVAIITRSEAIQSPWINFEIGVAYGSKKLSKIFVFGAVSRDNISRSPIAGFQLTDTGNTNRWVGDLKDLLDVEITPQVMPKEREYQFADVFRQKP